MSGNDPLVMNDDDRAATPIFNKTTRSHEDFYLALILFRLLGTD